MKNVKELEKVDYSILYESTESSAEDFGFNPKEFDFKDFIQRIHERKLTKVQSKELEAFKEKVVPKFAEKIKHFAIFPMINDSRFDIFVASCSHNDEMVSVIVNISDKDQYVQVNIERSLAALRKDNESS